MNRLLNFFKKDKSKLLLIILSLLLSGLSSYFAGKANHWQRTTNNSLAIIETKDSIITSAQYSITQINDINILLRDSLKMVIPDTITIIQYGDSINIIDSLIIYDSTIYREVIKYKDNPMGNILLTDSSNQFTDIKVLIDFPFGRREITYFNKYIPITTSQFSKYIGLGYGNNDIYLSGDIFYKDIGIGIIVGTDGKVQYFTKCHF